MNEILNQEKSIYIQISEMIENDILRDVLLEDERVPSTNELAKLYAINPATAAKGINILVDAGILYKKRGIGMFVSDGAKEVIRTKRKAQFYENYVSEIVNEAKTLGITKAELIAACVEYLMLDLKKQESEIYNSNKSVLNKFRQLLVIKHKVYPLINTAVYDELKKNYPEQWEKVNNFRQSRINNIIELLNDGVRAGEVVPIKD